MFAMLANAIDLGYWADRIMARSEFPRVIRRLVHATGARVLRSQFRAGEGVQLPGWDGIVDVESGNAWVPDGRSVWELSVRQDLGKKADDDYTKRTQDPLGIDPRSAAFVFVTPRKWAKKAEWTATRAAEGKWREVRAYDGDDLEHWLEAALAVHVWLSRLIGKHPQGVQDLESWWLDWSSTTEPAMTSGLVLAGRENTRHDIVEWFASEKTSLVARGESTSEAIAVVAAAIETLDAMQREYWLARMVLVEDPAAWKALCTPSEQLVLIPNYEIGATDVACASRSKHRVLIPLGRAGNESVTALDIPNLSRVALFKSLTEVHLVEKDRAETLALLGGRSLMALRRKLATVPGLERPEWSCPDQARTLLPALLAGRWSSAHPGDCAVLSRIAGRPFEALQADLTKWSQTADPPVRCVDTTWYLTSEEDAWLQLGSFLTPSDVERFQEIAVDVLGPADPKFELPQDKQWLAGLLGHRPSFSDLIRTGIATTLAILGSRGGGIRMVGGTTLEHVARRPVARLLATQDWKVWASLPLRLLAEAAPEEFLEAADRGVSNATAFLADLFRDKEADFFSSAVHTELLWALEILAWSPQHLTHAATVLAKLTQVDPGGSWANRPMASLRLIFLPWLPQTSASLNERMATLDALRHRLPNVAWEVMVSLMPKGWDTSHHTPRPKWREWAPPGEGRATRLEHIKCIQLLIPRMIQDAGHDGGRWDNLIEALPQLPPELFNAVVVAIEGLKPDGMEEANRSGLWNALRELVSDHRSYDEADWAMSPEMVDRLAALMDRFEPTRSLLRYGWLFGNRPVLPEGHGRDWNANERAIAERQCQAIEVLHEQHGLAWLPEFIASVDRPDHLGHAIGRSKIAAAVEDRLIQSYLSMAEGRYQFLVGLMFARIQRNEAGWAKDKLQALGRDWSPGERATLLACLPIDKPTWSLVDESAQEVVREYWRIVPVHFVREDEDVEYVVRRLLDHARPLTAVRQLELYQRRTKLSAELVAEALEALINTVEPEANAHSLSADGIGDLLAYLESDKGIEESRMARLEWAFLSQLGGRHHYSPIALQREMARNPAFFCTVVCLLYRAEKGLHPEPSEEERAKAGRAWELLNSWRWKPIPGAPDAEEIDPNALQQWVRSARELLSAEDRLDCGDRVLGEVLSGAPASGDGGWPHPAVRDLIEELCSPKFEQGIEIGVLNGEGVTWSDPNDAGKRERQTAERYGRFADVARSQWPRTAAMLRRLRDSYLNRAEHERTEDTLRGELGI